jgi:hypothetical protein
MESPSPFQIQQFKIPTESSVFGCSLLDHAPALQAARHAVDELRLRFPESTPSNVKAVYMSPWKSHHLTTGLAPLIQLVADKIKMATQQFLGVDLNKLEYDLRVADCWGAVYEQSDYTIPHTHYPSDFSAVIYLEMEEQSSSIIFENSFSVSPTSGSLVFFPGHLSHHVPATQGKRVIVVINYIKIPKMHIEALESRGVTV